MNKLFQESAFFLLFIMAGFGILPLYGQNSSANKHQQFEYPFIRKGKFLNGFSVGFTNASRSEFNQEFAREITEISLQLKGLYFVSNHVGVGPLLGYQFTYRDLVNSFRNGDSDTRNGQFKFGAIGGYYVRASQIFGGSSDINLFVSGGLSWLRVKFRQENTFTQKPEYQFGYQVGVGALFPVAKRIAIQTKLGFQARRQEFKLYKFVGAGKPPVLKSTMHKWPKQVALSVGLDVTF